MGRRTNMLIALAVAVSAVTAVAWNEDTKLPGKIERWLSLDFSQSSKTSYRDCVGTANEPACIAAKAVPLSAHEATGLLHAIITSGAPSLVHENRTMLVAAAQGRGPTQTRVFYSGDVNSRARDQVIEADESVVIAAIALLATAQVQDDPFHEPHVERLIKAAKASPEVAEIAVTLWNQATFAREWRAELVKPRGMSAILDAILAVPPVDSDLLYDLASTAGFAGFRDEEVALYRIYLARVDADPTKRQRIQRFLPLRTLPTQSSDTDRTRVFTECRSALAGVALQSIWCRSYFDKLSISQLNTLAEIALQTARAPNREAVERATSFGSASEIYRVLKDIPRARDVAREGLPLVPAALRRWQKTLQLETDAQRRKAVAGTIDTALDPVIALYRAGARDEALRTGFLNGYSRFKNASVAGEVPDVRWITADGSESIIEIVTDELTREPNALVALQLHDALECRGPEGYGGALRPEFHSTLAVLAALAGHAAKMTRHLAMAAQAVDQADGAASKQFASQKLAGDWRRALVISERVATVAKVPGRCGAPQ